MRSPATAFRLLVDAFAPMRCAGCDMACQHPVCEACRQALDELPAPRVDRLHEPAWIACFEYRDPLRTMIHRVKYRAHQPALGVLAQMAADRIAQGHDLAGDGMVAVPLGPRRMRQRGYNQAEVITQSIASRVGLPVLPGLLRVRETRPQAEIEGAARWRNVEGAFSWRGTSVRGARLWLVDDVVTTGATASAARAALRSAGARRVGILALSAVPRSPARTYDRS